MDVYEAALKRRSIRIFEETPVPYELLEKCVDTARLAPSTLNQQVLDFLVVDDPQKLPLIAQSTVMVRGFSGGVVRVGFEKQPKAYIFTLLNRAWAAEFGASKSTIPYDVAMANENMMLFAASEGLATCPILSYNAASLRQILEIPEQYQLTMILAMGYPGEKSVAEDLTDTIAFEMDEHGIRHVPKRKLTDVLHYNRIKGHK